MNSNDDDQRPYAIDETDVDEREVLRLVRRYTGADKEDDLGELQELLDELIQGDIVDIDPEGAGITVIVEREPDDGGEPIHDAYTVSPVTGLDGEPALDWSYLGPAK